MKFSISILFFFISVITLFAQNKPIKYIKAKPAPKHIQKEIHNLFTANKNIIKNHIVAVKASKNIHEDIKNMLYSDPRQNYINSKTSSVAIHNELKTVFKQHLTQPQ